MENRIYHDVVIIGAGPSGIKASLLLKEAGVDFIIIDGSTPGGKVNIAPRVDNYPDYSKISGPDLAMNLFMRLMDKGIDLIGEQVSSLKKDGDLFLIDTDYSSYSAKAVYIATGTQEKELGLPNEKEMFGHGLSYCALCDGHFFKGQEVAVIGGGNAALTEAAYLATICKKVYIIHRRKEWRGIKKKQDDLFAFDNVVALTPYVTKSINGKDHVESLTLVNQENGEEKELKISAVFPLVGQNPNTNFINIEGVIDNYRFIPVDKNNESPACPGLFAGGDVLPRVIKQIYLAERDAQIATNGILEYLKK